MIALEQILTTWRARLTVRLEAAEAGLIQTVAKSGVLDPDELDGLLRVGHYRGLVLHLGRALSMPEYWMHWCISTATAFGTARFHLLVMRTALWRYGGGYLAYALLPLAEPVQVIRSWWVALICSPAYLSVYGSAETIVRQWLLRLSNHLFTLLVFGATSRSAIRLAQWMRRTLWPPVAGATRFVLLLGSTCLVGVRLLGSERWTVLTVWKVFSALMRGRGGRKQEEGLPAAVVADAVLGRLPAAVRPKRATSELWIDVSPEGPLFGSSPVNGIRLLWQRIDGMTGLDASTYSEVVASFEGDSEEVVGAIRQIVRPPRPVLSAVLVATGLRMGIGERLATLRNPHLKRESSRWAFFGREQTAWATDRQCTIITPIGVHQSARIRCGKLAARVLEVLLTRGSGSQLRFLFALPVCRPGSEQARDREALKKLLIDSFAGCFFPPEIELSLLGDLTTDVALPNIKGLPLILALREVCSSYEEGAVIALSEMNDSASWLNVRHLIAALPPDGPVLVTGRRPMFGAGKSVAGHAATRLFNLLFRWFVPNVRVRDSSAVLKVMTVASLRAIVNDLTALDYSVDQDILAMMAVRGRVLETPIEWYQSLGSWGHERPASVQITSLRAIARKTVRKRRLARNPSLWLPLDAGFDFQAYVNDREGILKGYAPERNRLLLLLSAIRSILKPASVDRDGHREYAAWMPIALRLLEVVGQGPLKAILRVAEGRYRDPLPAVLEQLKYRVPAIVETTLVWHPVIETPAGTVSPFLFGLRQPFASLGTLGSALDWNVRSGSYTDMADTLQAICRLQRDLLSHGVIDPDLKSLLDCGLFLEGASVRAKHLDFAGFVRDPFVVEAVLPELLEKLPSMRDFFQISRRLGTTQQGRALVVRLHANLVEFVNEIPRQWRRLPPGPFAENADQAIARTDEGSPACREFTDRVLATAKFAAHAPVCPLPLQVLMRRMIGHGSERLLEGDAEVAVQHPAAANPLPEPVFLARPDLAEAIGQAMKEFAPGVNYEIQTSGRPDATPLMQLLHDASGRPGTRVLMSFAGQSSRMQHLLGGRSASHKGLLTVFGRPLFLHVLETIRIAAGDHPGLTWVTHPDTVCLWSGDSMVAERRGRIIAPLPRDVVRMLKSYPAGRLGGSAHTEAIAKLLVRCRLTIQTGGYSLPSVIGIDRTTMGDLPVSDARYGGAAEADFWGYLSTQLGLPERFRRGEVETPPLQTWFDLDAPHHVMAFYQHSLVPGFAEYFGATAAEARFDGFAWERSKEVSSTVQRADRDGFRTVVFRDCVFDHSTVRVDVDPNVRSATVEGLVVANSSVTLRIAAPIVRNNLVYGVTAPGALVRLALDGQAIGSGPMGEPVSVPLALQGFSRDGRNEVLRCPIAKS